MWSGFAVTPVPGMTIGLLAGAGLGAAYFTMLRLSVLRLLEAPRAGGLIMLLLGRFALAAGAFALLSTLGALALLAGLAGFLFGRRLVIRHAGARL